MVLPIQQSPHTYLSEITTDQTITSNPIVLREYVLSYLGAHVAELKPQDTQILESLRNKYFTQSDSDFNELAHYIEVSKNPKATPYWMRLWVEEKSSLLGKVLSLFQKAMPTKVENFTSYHSTHSERIAYDQIDWTRLIQGQGEKLTGELFIFLFDKANNNDKKVLLNGFMNHCDVNINDFNKSKIDLENVLETCNLNEEQAYQIAKLYAQITFDNKNHKNLLNQMHINSYLELFNVANFKDENRRIEIADLCRKVNGYCAVTRFDKFNISEEKSIEIAKRWALDNEPYLGQYFEKFNITNENQRFEIAKLYAMQNGKDPQLLIQKFNINDSQQQFEIFEICRKLVMDELSKQIEERKDDPLKKETSMEEIRRPHEAEDVKVRNRGLRRQTSMPDLKKATSTFIGEKEDIASKSSVFWDCLVRRPNKNGGYIYTFKLKDKYDYVHHGEKVKSLDDQARYAIYPAVEQNLREMGGGRFPIANKEKLTKLLNPNNYRDNFKDISSDDMDRIWSALGSAGSSDSHYLKRLGYTMEINKSDIRMTLPDLDALLANWEILREEDPTFPPLDIVSAEGIASDIDFMESYFSHDALLSRNKEFVHDQQVHVINVIRLMIHTRINYKKIKHERFQAIATMYKNLHLAKKAVKEGRIQGDLAQRCKNNFDKIETLLGAFTDSISSIETTESPAQLYDHYVAGNQLWIWYFMKRFKTDDTILYELTNLLKELDNVLHPPNPA